MKNLTRFSIVAAAGLASFGVSQAQAADGTGPEAIAGSISFAGTATTDSSSIATSTEFTSIAARVVTDSGDYALVPSLNGPTPGVTTLTSTGVVNVMTDYSFNPSQNTVTPLWKFTTGGITYAFDATTLTAVFDASDNAWDISGLGTAIISGGGTDYSATSGSWSAVVSGSGSTFAFGSSEDPPVEFDSQAVQIPDNGATIALMGGALASLCALRRKLA